MLLSTYGIKAKLQFLGVCVWEMLGKLTATSANNVASVLVYIKPISHVLNQKEGLFGLIRAYYTTRVISKDIVPENNDFGFI